MPFTILEETETRFLLRVPGGKHYLSESKTRIQSHQKGPNCWKYAFNILRSDTRIGKLNWIYDFEAKSEYPLSANVKQVIREREIEKAVSVHRKAYQLLTHTSQSIQDLYTHKLKQIQVVQKSYEDKLLVYKKLINLLENQFQLTSDDANVRAELKKAYEENNQLLDGLKECTIHLSDNYTAQTASNNDILKEEIELYKKTLLSLGVQDAESALRTWYGTQGELDTLSKQHTAYHQFVIYKAAEGYGLPLSTWNPAQGPDGLRAALKNEGPLKIATRTGVNFYKTDPQQTETLKDYVIHSWPEQKPEVDGLHSIVIVGVERLQTVSGDCDYVLFLDPIDCSADLVPRKLYRETYQTVINNLYTIYGIPVAKTDTAASVGCYAFAAPRPEKVATLQNGIAELQTLYREAVTMAMKQYQSSHPMTLFQTKDLRKLDNALKQDSSLLRYQINTITSDNTGSAKEKQKDDSLVTLLQKELSLRHLYFAKPLPVVNNTKNTCTSHCSIM